MSCTVFFEAILTGMQHSAAAVASSFAVVIFEADRLTVRCPVHLRFHALGTLAFSFLVFGFAFVLSFSWLFLLADLVALSFGAILASPVLHCVVVRGVGFLVRSPCLIVA